MRHSTHPPALLWPTRLFQLRSYWHFDIIRKLPCELKIPLSWFYIKYITHLLLIICEMIAALVCTACNLSQFWNSSCTILFPNTILNYDFSSLNKFWISERPLVKSSVFTDCTFHYSKDNTGHNCWNAWEVFLPFPFNVDLEDVYAQVKAWKKHWGKEREAMLVFTRRIS